MRPLLTQYSQLPPGSLTHRNFFSWQIAHALPGGGRPLPPAGTGGGATSEQGARAAEEAAASAEEAAAWAEEEATAWVAEEGAAAEEGRESRGGTGRSTGPGSRGGTGSWPAAPEVRRSGGSPTDRAYAAAASTAVSKVPMLTNVPPTVCFARKRPEGSLATRL